MYMNEDYMEIARLADGALREEFRLYGFAVADVPAVSAGLVKVVLAASAQYQNQRRKAARVAGFGDGKSGGAGGSPPAEYVNGAGPEEEMGEYEGDALKLVNDLYAERITFRKLDEPMRRAVVRAWLLERAKAHGGYGQVLFLEEKPSWMPSIQTVRKLFGCRWSMLMGQLKIGRPESHQVSGIVAEKEAADFLA